MKASELAAHRLSATRGLRAINVDPIADVTLAHGDVVAARRWADEAVSVTAGYQLALALTTRARFATAQGEPSKQNATPVRH